MGSQTSTAANSAGSLYATNWTRVEGCSAKARFTVVPRQALVRCSPQFTRVITQKLMTYALGRGVEYYDMPLVRSIVRDSERNNYHFSSIVMGIVKSAPFQTNMKVQPTEE